MSRRRMTVIEWMEYGQSLPDSLWLDRRGKPLMSRAEWEQLGRWRRLRDVLQGIHPPNVKPREFSRHR
jgi:hypothetical protein